MRIPLPPGSVVRLKKLWPHARKHGREVGQVYRLGYYCRHCGPTVVWLVDTNGEYNWTVDHDFIARFFEVVEESKERSLYGKNRATLDRLTDTDVSHLLHQPTRRSR